MKYSERVVHRSKSKQKEDFQKVKIITKNFKIFRDGKLRHIYNTGRFNIYIMANRSGLFIFLYIPESLK